MNQIALPFEWPAAEKEADFIVTAANQIAVRHLSHIGLWPIMATILTGPRKSGRSFLGRIFAARSGGTLMDDADRADEEAIFHAWNRAQADRRPLLLIADAPPPVWEIKLPDLGSRLAATPHVSIAEPDDALLLALIERMTAARGIALAKEVPAWIAHRIERSYVAIQRVIDVLDQAAWTRRGRLNLVSAREALLLAAVIEDS